MVPKHNGIIPWYSWPLLCFPRSMKAHTVQTTARCLIVHQPEPALLGFQADNHKYTYEEIQHVTRNQLQMK